MFNKILQEYNEYYSMKDDAQSSQSKSEEKINQTKSKVTVIAAKDCFLLRVHN